MTKKQKLKMSAMVFVGTQSMKGNLPLKIVWQEVCNFFEIDEKILRSKNQKKEIITARHVYYYLAKKHTRATLRLIGEYGSDDTWKSGHSNVQLMGKKVGLMLTHDYEYKLAVETIEQILNVKKYG